MPIVIEELRQVIFLHIRPCPRCGGTHAGIAFNEVETPGLYEWFAICPETKQPIMLAITTDAGTTAARG
jgi:hypothetical protein